MPKWASEEDMAPARPTTTVTSSAPGSQPALLLLGSPRLEQGGRPADVDTRKAIALLAYLAVTHQRQSRDALAVLLWPDYDQAHARAALRRTLSTLNKALAGEWLETDRENIGLRADSLWVDVDHFRSGVAACRTHGHAEDEVCANCFEPLIEAVRLYRADFMAGFSLRDSPQFDDWQYLEAEGLRRELAGALERLVRIHAARREWQPAVTYARRWLSLDPLHEGAHRMVMQVYTWAGQRPAALRQYRECARVLEEELGVSPAEETTALYQAIKDEQVLPLPILSSAPPSDAPSNGVLRATVSVIQNLNAQRAPEIQNPTVPLFGRATEWNIITKAYTTNGGHMLVLEGEAGVGKTRLAEEFLAHVRAQGATTITAHCYPGETNLAYGPFVECLSALVSQPPHAGWLEQVPPHFLSEAARLLPEVASLGEAVPPTPPLDTPGAQSRFFEGISHVLQAAFGNTRGVLFFDDLQWADTASLGLLTYLTRRLHGRSPWIVATWRSEQVQPNHRLRRLLADLQRAGKATLLSLSRLDRSAVAAWVRAVAGDSTTTTDELWQRLYAETEGLPLFVQEYLTAIAQGTLSGEHTAWSLPGGVRDLLHGRIGTVSQTSRQVLATAAVIGRSFDFDTVREVSGRSEDETIGALEELMASGLVEEVASSARTQHVLALPAYDFSHEKLRAVVYDETSQARRRLLHRRVAETLANRTGRRHDGGFETGPYSLIAYHYGQAGLATEAASYYKLAGEHARALYANTEALAHFQAALALGHPDAAVLHEAIGDLHTLLGDYAAALASYGEAITLGTPESRADVEHKLGIVYGRRGEWEQAEQHLQAALAALGAAGSTAQRARLYADWSLVAHRQGQPGRAAELACQALELADAAGDTRSQAEAHNRLGILATSRGDLAQARHDLEQSLRLAEALSDPSARAAALNNLALACKTDGDIEQALRLTEEALALCAAQGDRHHEAALHNNLADLLHAAGQSAAAMSHLKQAVTIYAEIGVEAGAVQPAIWKLSEW